MTIGKVTNKYDRLIKPKLEQVEEWSSRGMTQKDMAKALGVGYTSFRNYKEEYPELQEAIDRGQISAVQEVEGALFKRAIGYEYEEETEELKNIDGKKTAFKRKVKKHQAGDTLAMMYYLNNRAPDKWKARREDKGDTDMNVTISFEEEKDNEG